MVRKLLDHAFTRLGLADPDSHLRLAIASWPVDAVVEGIAIFEGKRGAGTLPAGVDGRYLLGIVRRVAEEDEGWRIAEALLRERLAARDDALAHLDRQRDAVQAADRDTTALVKAFIDNALAAPRGIDRMFWLLATTDVILAAPPDHHLPLLRLAARRIHATHALPHRERLAATRLLFAKAIPIA